MRKLTIENCLFISAKLYKLFIWQTATKTKCKKTILATEIQNCVTFPNSIELNSLEPEFFCFLLYYCQGHLVVIKFLQSTLSSMLICSRFWKTTGKVLGTSYLRGNNCLLLFLILHTLPSQPSLHFL